MASFIGRDAVLTWNAVAIAGVRTKGLTIANSSIDITSGDDSGIRKLLEEAGERTVDITCSGVAVNPDLLADAMAGSVSAVLSLAYPAGFDTLATTISGTFFMSSFAITGEYNGAATFDATFNSSGVIAIA